VSAAGAGAPDGSRVAVVLNPASGKGRGARAEPALRAAFAAAGVRDVRVTSAAGDEQRVARRAIDDGATTLVAAGGDGTWGNVANAILASGADVRLALVATGTGNDFAKTVGAPAADYAATARLAVGGPTRASTWGASRASTSSTPPGSGSTWP
jgi:diacylglycerol kinase (ATP)